MEIVELPRRKPRKMPKRSRIKRKPKKRKKSRTNLVGALDAVFSRFIRQKYAKDGIVACYTCGRINTIAKMQNGHYVGRAIRILRWNEDNCRPQCYGCNVMQRGQVITFRENLIKELGESSVIFLEISRHTLFKPSDKWLTNEIAKYEEKVALLSDKTITPI